MSAGAFTTRPDLRGSFGAVAASHWLGTACGMAVLERGGNACDAAAAAGFVLQVVEPHLNGPGGELPVILKMAHAAEPVVICGQGTYPALATPERFAALGLAQVPGTGLLPAVVPGAFDAWMLLLRDYGTWPLADVLSYAIGYAETGFPLLARTVQSIIPAVDLFQAEWPSSGEVWLAGGRAPRPGNLHRTSAIAATYRRLIAEAEAAGRDRVEQIEAARRAFYTGFVAEAVDRFYRTDIMDSSGRRHAGLLRGDDLAGYEARVEPTVSRSYHGLQVHKTGPWGQGPVMLQCLAMLEGFDLAGLDPLGDAFVHLVAECMKLCYADREVFYGDPLFNDVPLGALLSDAYAAERRKLVGDDAFLELRPGNLPGAYDRMARVVAMAGSETPIGPGGGEPTFAPIPVEWGDTVHLDVVDRFGNMVSATPSGGWLQGSPVVPELGFPITTRGQMGWLEDGHPSTVRPGMRPRTTLTPTLVTRDGAAVLAAGTPGGDQQDQWTLSALLHRIHHGHSLQQAIDAPLFHSRHFPSSFHPRSHDPARLVIEDRFPAATLDGLRARGHRLTIEGPWSIGRVCGVEADKGTLSAAASPRLMQAYAAAR